MSEAQPPDRPWLVHYSPRVPAALPAPALTAIDQFRASVARAPTSPAIHYFDTTLSYGDLDRLSSALAAALCRSGVQRGDRVALDLQNMPQFWIALLASWKSGAIVVPLNPMFKAAELEYHLNDSGAAALISLESRYATLGHEVVPRTSVRLVITTCELDLLHDDRRPAVLAGVERARLPGTPDLLALCEQYAGAADPQTSLELHDIALLTYTSGTTGQPKGAMNSHSNVAANAEVYRTWANLGSGDVIIGMAPLFHITGMVSHLATAGLAGLPLILAYRFDAGELLRLIERWRGSFTVAAITAFVALMNHPSIHARDLSSLRKAYSGGAPIPPALVERFQSLTGAYIHNVYGLTESTSPALAVPLGKIAPVDPVSGALAIGLPVPGTLVRVAGLDAGDDAEPGALGELLIKGPGVVTGYWHKPAESAQALHDDWLATGDIGCMDQAGWFYLVDRKKDVIIASGFKVWPREVEDVLYQHPAVREAAVIGVPDDYRGETVKAFVALKPNAAVTPDELMAFCRDRIAAYKYPRALEIVAELPKTTTGKILRRALRQPPS